MSGKKEIDIKGILDRIPHRFPFVMVDRVLDISNKKITAIKNATFNEWFFQGHFPGAPVMPGVLIVEGMAQSAAILMIEEYKLPHDLLMYFMTIDKVKFRKPVTPGDQIVFQVEIKHFSNDPKRPRGKFKGQALVNGVVVAEAEMGAIGTKKEQ